ncbi:Sec-independent protein translocase subunit TatA/TatB [Bacteroidetes bacterium endosymbiont of Geopemphigus sp.]|uniref:Sec-independent protein translocase subunit TatA/TatB n=1 Tax=Bacteroidetes bacterium endosymbiont of Geopemphigus sp. TaxID=2047937 RepID=UPI000CD20EA7|nr:twin-arginine translocase TatA/TatE family subunit [Bacteroidetes bacterium endosymbiont of Geopemphigus sp.]
MIFLFISFEQSFFILLVALLIFGPKKIPEVARSLGEGIRHLRNITQEIKQQIWEASERGEDLKDKVEQETKKITKEIDETFTGSVKRDD